MTYSLRPDYDREFDSSFNRNEYKEYFVGGKGGRCVFFKGNLFSMLHYIVTLHALQLNINNIASYGYQLCVFLQFAVGSYVLLIVVVSIYCIVY
jgi:hypothetical protein